MREIKFRAQSIVVVEGGPDIEEGARELAIKSKQIKPDHGTLYSEDLW